MPTSPLLQLPNTYRAFFGAFAELHPIQRETIAPILAGRDLVLQSATGSGKTEAVLAPCMERVIRSGRTEAVLYVVPTRALAIDLQRRLTPILSGRLGLQLGIRTGDVKRAGGARPDLILTTPESLDVLLGNANAELHRFIQRVRMVVVDEVHPLLHQVRGKQLAYLLRRLEHRAGVRVQRIALSATIADAQAITAFFGFAPDAARLIRPVQRDIVPHLVRLVREDEELLSLLDDLYDAWAYRKILLFANSRGHCDRLFALATQRGRFRGVAALHYSNLKPRERHAVEERFRSRSHALCIATSTLELGIDVGDVDGVLLFEPPDSVSAFLQRIGRSNRRGQSTRFWGICRGERAGEQLLRFLALLARARQGVVEAPLPNPFPSVLIQQTLSCLYEKKVVSLPAMQALFPEDAEALGLIFPALEKLGWLRRRHLTGGTEASESGAAPPPVARSLFRGGWRYRNAFMDRKIWSNFPETEEDTPLEVDGEAVADLPPFIVRQLEPGDRLHLAGRRIQILQIIDAGERRRVIATPTEEPDDKELLWLGTGFQISFEVAQAMRDALGLSEEADEASGLFTRTRRLLRAERGKRTVTLANGIEVLRETGALYRYRTFLGSMGNLILRLTIQHDLGHLEELYVRSDEIGITCSHWIEFQGLSLPRNRNGFLCWVREHLRLLRSLLPLNAFADALPNGLLVEELTGFLYDHRVAGCFAHYASSSSEIVSGDPATLELLPLTEHRAPVHVLLQSSAARPLLDWEKERRSVYDLEPTAVLSTDVHHEPRAITGTMIGEHMRHQQCERRLSFQFLPRDRRPLARPGWQAELQEVRMEYGRRHEERVLATLHEHGVRLERIEAQDGRGTPLSLNRRFSKTVLRLGALCAALTPGESFFLAQGALILDALLGRSYAPELAAPDVPLAGGEAVLHGTDGVGIPDLIRGSLSDGRPLLEVGDIKDSSAPHSSQKWQVAFYALLLQEALRPGRLPVEAIVSPTGFLITRRGRGLWEPALHRFDLAPYLAAFPALLQNMGDVLVRSPAAASYRLQEHCTTCPYFEICYAQALREEDIQLLPQLSPGALWTMRQLGLANIGDAERWFNAREV